MNVYFCGLRIVDGQLTARARQREQLRRRMVGAFALQYAGALSGARTTAVYQTRPSSSSIGLCALALLSQIASLPQ